MNAFVTRDSNPAELAWLTWYANKLDRDGVSRWAYDYWHAAGSLDLRRLSHMSGVALLDGLVGDNHLSLARATDGLVRDDLVRATAQLDIVSAEAQAIAGGCG